MSTQVPALGSVLVNRYELVEELGRGGCAVVFGAHDHRLARAVAVKVPIGIAGDTAKVGRFAREARVIASIHHPNVCAVLDSGFTEDGVPFLVMERLFGESLRATIHRAKRLPVGDAIAIGLQLLSALDAVHAAGIVHRDVKPDNVILVSRGGCDPLVKLLDFGLCRRAARRRADEETMTREGALVGTPEYMAPEQVIGSATLDARADIYAVGVVLYEALTGDRAFFAKNIRDILSGVMNKRLRPLREARRDAPRSLEVAVARAMSREPARRHATAAELQADLVAVKEEIAALARAAQRRAEAEVWDLPTTPFQRRLPPRRPPAPAG
ncbi:MAG: serine/threonine protein kinase [Labilithrix sp.]|nr:serine/threonine protein kinase [Labilithrix sp.]